MEFTGKTVEEAVEIGLKMLDVSEENAVITVIEEPKKGFLGKLKGNAIVRIEVKEFTEEPKNESAETVTENKKVEKTTVKKAEKKESKKEEKANVKDACEFISEVLSLMKIEGNCEVVEGENPTIKINTADSASVIGYRGEVLDALQTLASAVANIGNDSYKKVAVDCEDYRLKREETLIALAHKLEAKATEMRREVILEPMNPFERRIIHTALANSETVKTESSGKEPERYVVIIPNDKEEGSRPYNAGKNKERKGGKDFKGDRRDKKGFKKYDRKKSGFTEEKRKPSSSFSTYLGNSQK